MPLFEVDSVPDAQVRTSPTKALFRQLFENSGSPTETESLARRTADYTAMRLDYGERCAVRVQERLV
jgi:hypothetical protein